MPQKQTGCLQAVCYLSARGLASDKEDGAHTHTQSCLALAWILPGWGRQSRHQGHAS